MRWRAGVTRSGVETEAMVCRLWLNMHKLDQNTFEELCASSSTCAACYSRPGGAGGQHPPAQPTLPEVMVFCHCTNKKSASGACCATGWAGR